MIRRASLDTWRLQPIFGQRRTFYSGLSQKQIQQKLNSTFHHPNLSGRQPWSADFEKSISLVGWSVGSNRRDATAASGNHEDDAEAQSMASPFEASSLSPSIALVEPLRLQEMQATQWSTRGSPLFESLYSRQAPKERGLLQYPVEVQRNLRKNGDSWVAKHILPASGADGAGGDGEEERVVAIINVVDPDVEHKSFHFEEAGAELVAAYRNILYDFYELKWEASTKDKILRIPVLCQHVEKLALKDRVPKLNQMSVIKGFHRCPQEVRDWYAWQGDHFKLQLYVPQLLLPSYTKTFEEDAWAPPAVGQGPRGHFSNYYPSMPLPESLLELPEYVGKRTEILDAPKTDGESLLTPLDEHSGKPIEKKFIGGNVALDYKKRVLLPTNASNTHKKTLHWKSPATIAREKGLPDVAEAEVLSEETMGSP